MRRGWRLWAPGDLNAFSGLVVDNLTQLVVLSGILVGVFRFPAELVLYRIVPGTAMGVLAGNLAYTWLAVRLAGRTGRDDVTAMPFGIDTPSLFGITFGILGPLMLLTRDAELAWKVGMGTTVAMGVVNGALAGAGRSVADLTGEAALAVETVRVLGNGFILTALVWGSMTALIVDHRLRSAAAVSALASVATLVGVIHSPLPTGGLFWPGSLESAWPGRLAGAYGLLATLLMGLAALRATPGAGGTGETPRP